jgi:DNA-binding Lrp family transcriptional regulator
MIYFLAQNSREVAYFIYTIQTLTLFNEYIAEWYTTPDFPDFGFIPLRQKSFSLIAEKVWKRSKEIPRPPKGSISQREFNVLYELNQNGAIDFTNIDKAYGLGSGAAQYTYHKLKENGTLKRVTITMLNLPIKYNAIIMVSIVNGSDFGKNRAEILKEIIDDRIEVNKYTLVSDVELPHGIMFIMPVFNDQELALTQDHIKSKLNGIEVKTLIITDVILGSLCYRKQDKYQTAQYKLLTEEYKLET